jgi:hypothetical protein
VILTLLVWYFCFSFNDHNIISTNATNLCKVLWFFHKWCLKGIVFIQHVLLKILRLSSFCTQIFLMLSKQIQNGMQCIGLFTVFNPHPLKMEMNIDVFPWSQSNICKTKTKLPNAMQRNKTSRRYLTMQIIEYYIFVLAMNIFPNIYSSTHIYFYQQIFSFNEHIQCCCFLWTTIYFCKYIFTLKRKILI